MNTIFKFLKRNDLYLRYIDIKKRSSLKFYDAHTHPNEVLGVNKNCCERRNKTPSLVEILEYNVFILTVLKFFFRYFPSFITKSINFNFSGVSKIDFLDDMQATGIDVSAVLPVLPNTDVDSFKDFVHHDNFVVLGSIDIHSIDETNIEQEIKRQVAEFGILGIKLHPNIQKFYPIPDMNGEVLCKKLKILYSTINKYNLYVHFHAGTSYLPSSSRYKKHEYGKIENFFKDNFKSTVFDYIETPVIIAHLGNYNLSYPDFKYTDELIKRYNNISFDTAGVSPYLVKKFINRYGLGKFVFGSDALYFNLKHSLVLMLEVLEEIDSELSFSERVEHFFSKNYLKIIDKIKK
jgi:predicted TIM-barrel fold metal-dependent hydrolase